MLKFNKQLTLKTATSNYLNTSNVKVQLTRPETIKVFVRDLNTSNVKVQRPPFLRSHIFYYYLNTSNVKVQQVFPTLK